MTERANNNITSMKYKVSREINFCRMEVCFLTTAHKKSSTENLVF